MLRLVKVEIAKISAVTPNYSRYLYNFQAQPTELLVDWSEVKKQPFFEPVQFTEGRYTYIQYYYIKGRYHF